MSAASNLPDLPRLDALIRRGLGAADCKRLSERWADRAKNERSTSVVFAHIERALGALDAPRALRDVAHAAIDDETRHGDICDYCAEQYAGHERVPRSGLAPPAPRFAGCNEHESSVLFLILHCCLNEGIAAAYLRAGLERATTELVRAALRTILRDEIRHARLGWAFLATASNHDRALVAEALPKLLDTVLGAWLDPRDYPGDLPEGHGSLGVSALESTVFDAVDHIILPGFEHLTIDTQQARASLPARHRSKTSTLEAPKLRAPL